MKILQDVQQGLPEEEKNPQVVETGAPDLAVVNNRHLINQALHIEDGQQNQHDQRINCPHIADSPINEFSTKSYIACAFPTLFP